MSDQTICFRVRADGVVEVEGTEFVDELRLVAVKLRQLGDEIEEARRTVKTVHGWVDQWCRALRSVIEQAPA